MNLGRCKPKLAHGAEFWNPCSKDIKRPLTTMWSKDQYCIILQRSATVSDSKMYGLYKKNCWKWNSEFKCRVILPVNWLLSAVARLGKKKSLGLAAVERTFSTSTTDAGPAPRITESINLAAAETQLCWPRAKGGPSSPLGSRLEQNWVTP